MAKAVRWAAPAAKEVSAKPWLKDMPRLIFISDMGDALCASEPFPYLHEQVIANVSSAYGERHVAAVTKATTRSRHLIKLARSMLKEYQIFAAAQTLRRAPVHKTEPRLARRRRLASAGPVG